MNFSGFFLITFLSHIWFKRARFTCSLQLLRACNKDDEDGGGSRQEGSNQVVRSKQRARRRAGDRASSNWSHVQGWSPSRWSSSEGRCRGTCCPVLRLELSLCKKVQPRCCRRLTRRRGRVCVEALILVRHHLLASADPI